MEPLESVLHVLGRDRAQGSHNLMGGAGKLSMVPRPQTSCPVLHAQLTSEGPAGGWPAVLLFPRPQVAWQQEERATCLPFTFSTKVHASGHQSARASSTCPGCIQVPSAGALQIWHPVSGLLGWSEEWGERQRSSCSFRQGAQCWSSGSDFPRNSLGQRTTISQTRDPASPSSQPI